MNAAKKRSKCASERKCDFCRSTIAVGEIIVTSQVYDEFGRYTVRHHEHCDRTADLTAVAQKGFC